MRILKEKINIDQLFMFSFDNTWVKFCENDLNKIENLIIDYYLMINKALHFKNINGHHLVIYFIRLNFFT